jgi:glutathione S-transferase
MLTLYADRFSPNSRKVHWALEECGAPYEYKLISLRKGEQKTPEFVKLNPNGRVPVIIDDDFVLWESNAILWYVADKFGKGKIVPDDVRKRAIIDQWMWWQASDLALISKPWFMKLMGKLGQQVDVETHARALQTAMPKLPILEGHLKDRKYVTGDEFSIGDIALAEFAGLSEMAGADMEPFPAIRAWLARLAERPAFQKTRPPA